jgi:hypothetical protein
MELISRTTELMIKKNQIIPVMNTQLLWKNGMLHQILSTMLPPPTANFFRLSNPFKIFLVKNSLAGNPRHILQRKMKIISILGHPLYFANRP